MEGVRLPICHGVDDILPLPNATPKSKPSPFDTLATEIIQEIFRAACSSINIPELRWTVSKPNVNPHILALVCKRWSEIVVAYPPLWTEIFVYVPVSRSWHGSWPHAARLRGCLENSGTLPLNIYIDHEGYGSHGNINILSAILDCIIPCSERWKTFSLRIALDPLHLLKLKTIRDRLPILECLLVKTLSHSTNHEMVAISSDVFLTAPSLVNLGCENLNTAENLRSFNVPWKQLSQLSLLQSSFSRGEFAKVLTALPLTLTCLIFSGITCAWGHESESLTSRPIRLDGIRELRLAFICNQPLEYLLAGFMCPSLKQLEAQEFDAAILARFIRKSFCELISMSLKGLEESDVLTILENCQLTTLKTFSLEIDFLHDSILNMLVASGPHIQFPALQSIAMTSTDMTINPNSELGPTIKILKQVIKSRTSTPSQNYSPIVNTQLCLLKQCFFTFNAWGSWDDSYLEDLKSFCLSQKIIIKVNTYKYSGSYIHKDRDDIALQMRRMRL